MKLFRVKLKGMQGSTGSNTSHGTPYVIAPDPTTAYAMVKKYVDEHDLGFTYERELESIELLAETGEYPACGEHLFTAT